MKLFTRKVELPEDAREVLDLGPVGLTALAVQARTKSLDLSPALQTALAQGPMSFTPEGSVTFSSLFGSSYGALYKRNSALRAVVDFLSRNIAQCRIRLLHEDAEGVRLPEQDHPVQRLLDHPQAGVPRSRFMRQVVGDVAVYDAAAIWKIRENFEVTGDSYVNSGPVASLVRIPTRLVSIQQASLVAPFKFLVQGGRESIPIPAKDMIWIHGYSPDSNVQGVPPLETLRQVLAEEWAAGKDRENLWTHGPQARAYFYQPPELDSLDKAQKDAFKTEWNNRYGGVNATEAQGTPMLPTGIELRSLVLDAQTQEYLATRNLAREEVCRAYGIQPQLLGITPANFASMDMFHQMLYVDTLAPWMVAIQEEFEEQLLREFEIEDSGYYLDYNINSKMMGSFVEQADIGQKAVGGPWMLGNEFREKFMGLPPIPGGDRLITPSNVVRGGGPQANPQDAQNQFTGKVVQLQLVDDTELNEGESR